MATSTGGILTWVTSRIRWHLYLKKYYSWFQHMTPECDLASQLAVGRDGLSPFSKIKECPVILLCFENITPDSQVVSEIKHQA